ncbi:MAG: hypothetical protein M0R50_11290 [Candidatus Cloacimonetes bacterium]|jgi:hypothetical protein|nr:hypothetical protein [Candidatus Cloacimonadota bacterium]
MPQILETPVEILRTWKWCQEAYATHGVKLAFPKDTNPKKTYQWRYATKLANKIDEWELDKQTAKAFINIAVGYIKERNLLHKGMSVFFQDNMIDICYDRMQKHTSCIDDRINRFSATHKFIKTKCRNRTPVSVLLGRESFDKMRNIVRWYKSNDITASYLSMSIVCTEALSKLAVIVPDERNLLPSDAELYCQAIDLLKNDDFESQAKTILGNDWRMLCRR